MGYYPVFLELQNRPCLVIGGGQVAASKAKALISCGARVNVVSPALSSELQRLLKQRKIRWRKGSFGSGDLKNAELVVGATDDARTNQAVSRLCKKKRIWVNVVDEPRLCSFIVPSVVRRGKLVLAISTGGASPALAKWIRKDLEKQYGPEMSRLLSRAARVRGKVKEKVAGIRHRKQLYEEALKAYFKVLNQRIR